MLGDEPPRMLLFLSFAADRSGWSALINSGGRSVASFAVQDLVHSPVGDLELPLHRPSIMRSFPGTGSLVLLGSAVALRSPRYTHTNGGHGAVRPSPAAGPSLLPPTIDDVRHALFRDAELLREASHPLEIPGCA